MDYYRKGRTYELFIRKAFNYKTRKKHGADEFLMIRLFANEQNKEYEKSSIPYDRQFFKVKLNIEKALIKLSKRKKYRDSYEHFLPFCLKLRDATTPNDLVKIVSAGLSKIIEIENQLKRSA